MRYEAIEVGGMVVGRSWRAKRSWRSTICRLFGHKWGEWDEENVRVCRRRCSMREERFRPQNVPMRFGEY